MKPLLYLGSMNDLPGFPKTRLYHVWTPKGYNCMAVPEGQDIKDTLSQMLKRWANEYLSGQPAQVRTELSGGIGRG
jgi:hypothetical protein